MKSTASVGVLASAGGAALWADAVSAQTITDSGFDILNYQPMVADPFTWAWFGTQLANGAAAWVGGQILNELLGNGGVDLESLVKNIAEAVRVVVRQEIERATLLRLAAEHRALQSLFQIYATGCDRGIWNELITGSSTVIEELRGLGFPAHYLFLSAMAQHIVLIQEGFGRTPETKDLLTPLIERASGHLDRLHSEWRVWHNSRYSISRTVIPGDRPPDGPPNDRVLWHTMRDGVVYATYERGRPRDDAITTMTHIREVDWDSDTFPRFVKPSIEIQAQWGRLLGGSFEDDPQNPYQRVCR
ncbi:hypothetical protein [Ruegeria sp. AD91A]|uniref:hypothetical protein n=1 Tax=Ruegeria sp. AD91A TaxID=2293862 RepID=UPI0013C321A6|nr:hypothetical protein [Ruegeria sp. AD91A]